MPKVKIPQSAVVGAKGITKAALDEANAFWQHVYEGNGKIIVPVGEDVVAMHDHSDKVFGRSPNWLQELDGRPAMMLEKAIFFKAGFTPEMLNSTCMADCKPDTMFSKSAGVITESFHTLGERIYKGLDHKAAAQEYSDLLVHHGIVGENLADQVVRRTEQVMHSAKQAVHGISKG